MSEGWPTPEQAALESMPVEITHVVKSMLDSRGGRAWVLLAVEVRGTGFYLDENGVELLPDGSWAPSSSFGGGFTDRSIESACAPTGMAALHHRLMPARYCLAAWNPPAWPRSRCSRASSANG